MPQYTHSFDDIDFLVRTCTPEQIAQTFSVDADKVRALMSDPKALAEYLAASVETFDVEVLPIEEVPQVFEQIRVDYGYETFPRGKYVFIRPCPAEHPARIVFPKSHQSDQEIGFIHAVDNGFVSDLKKGFLVVYDRFSAIGAAFDVVDDSGEPCYVVQVDQAAVSAILQRRDLNVVD